MASADIDQWTPNDSIWEAVREQLKTTDNLSTRHHMGLELTMSSAERGGEIGVIQFEDVSGIAFAAAAPHTDSDFDRHFLLFVVDGPGTTVLEAWNTTQESKVFDDTYAMDPIPKKAPHMAVALVPGTLILFDGHRLHRAVVAEEEKAWVMALREVEKDRVRGEESSLEAARRAGLLQHPAEAHRVVTRCVSLEFKRKPTPAMAETALLKHLETFAPLAFGQATASLQSAPVRRPRLRP